MSALPFIKAGIGRKWNPSCLSRSIYTGLGSVRYGLFFSLTSFAAEVCI